VSRTRTLGIAALTALLVALIATLLWRDWLWSTAGNRALQSLGGWLTAPMRAITFLGDEVFYLLMMPLVYWCIHKGLGADFAALIVISGFANGCLKSLVKRSRPFWEAPGLQLSRAVSFSTPSGHAQSSAALYGYLAWFLAGRGRGVTWAVLLALLAALVALSRVYLGVHYPGDILWGAAIGLTIAALYAALKPVLVPRLKEMSLAEHLIMAPVTAAAMLAVMALLRSVPFGNSARFPELYGQAMNATIEESAAVSGLALGLWIGLVAETRYVRFSVAGPVRQRALRYAIGAATLAVIWFGLGVIMPAEPSALSVTLRVARYALVMGWAAAGWPWLFVRLGLGEREDWANL
jgi:membrane-associated phospholipid phosphatase